MAITSSSNIDILLVVSAIVIYASYLIYVFQIKSKPSVYYSIAFWTLGWLGLLILLIKPNQTIDINVSPGVIASTPDLIPENLNSLKRFSSLYEFFISEDYSLTDSLYIVDGQVSQDDLKYLTDVYIQSVSEGLQGFEKIKVEKAFEGRPFAISGKVSPLTYDKVLVSFYNDQLGEVEPDSAGYFELPIKFQASGHYLVDVSGVSSTDTLSHPLSIKVHPNEALNFLIIDRFPTFEVNYLKNFIASLGHGVAIRNQVSQDKFISSFVNIDRVALNPISTKLISRFQTILMSIDQWNKIGTGSRDVILEHVFENGASVVLIPSDDTYLARDIPSYRRPKSAELNLEPEKSKFKLNTLDLKGSDEWEEIKYKNNAIGIKHTHGIGFVSIFGIAETFPLLLSGNKKLYSSIWSQYFYSIVKNFEVGSRIIFPDLVWRNEPVQFNYISSSDIQQSLVVNQSSRVPLQYVPFLEGHASGTYFFESGWNSITSEIDGYKESIYVYEEDDWPIIRLNRLNQMADRHNQIVSTASQNLKTQEVPISFFWGLMCFAIGFGGMWLRERIMG